MNILQPTYGHFALRGVTVGLSNERSISDGKKEGKDEWKRLNFGVKVNDNSVIYVELMGTKTSKVKLIHRDSKNGKYDMSNTMLVNWGEHGSKREDNYKLFMPVKLNIEHNTYSNTEVLTSYEAAEHIINNLRNGDIVYIQGSIQISEYKGAAQEKLSIQSIFLDNGLVPDFSSLTYQQEAFFSQEIVFLNMTLDKDNYKYLVETNILYKKDGDIIFTPYSFFIDYGKYRDDEDSLNQSRELIKFFKNEIAYGSTIEVHGNINHYIKKIDTPDGFLVTGGSIKEFEIVGVNSGTHNKGRYTEEDFIVKTNPFITIDETDEDNEPF